MATEQKQAERDLIEATRRTEEANKVITEKNRTLEALYSEIRDKNRQLEEQAAQIAEWNARLETRVTEQVTQISQMSKLTRFLSPKVSDLIMAGDADDPLKTRRRDITVVFVDLRGFTGFTETAEPEEVMSVLREYHAELGREIMAYDGTIEHFSGDGVMILFNDPVPVPDHELQAIRMALRMRVDLGEEEAPEIGLIALIDCIFFLLMFFMVATSFKHASGEKPQKELPVTLPAAQMSFDHEGAAPQPLAIDD